MKGKRSAVVISCLDAGASGESTPVRVDQMPRCRYLDPTIAHVKRLDLLERQSRPTFGGTGSCSTQSRLNSVTAETNLRSSRDEHN